MSNISDTPYTDAAIVELYFARDEQAIKRTDERYGKFCHRLALNILSNTQDAEECVSDTYIQAWNSIPPTRPRSLQAFLGRIVKNISINRYHEKKAKRRNRDFDLSLEELEECIPMPDEDADKLPSLLNDFLGGLDETDCALFMGRYWHGYPVKELARGHGMTANAVSIRLQKTREKLRIYLNERGYRL